MDAEIKEFFYQVYTGEAKAVLRLKLFAEVAEKEGYPQIAKLFRAIAISEEIHGKRSLRMIGKVKDTEQNLKESFESEKNVAEISYDSFLKRAIDKGDSTAAKIFSQSRDAEEVHAKLYKEAMGHMLEENETTYYICPVCGYISDGVLPDQCPICGAKKESFIRY